MDIDLTGLCDDSCDDIVHMGATTVRATTLWRQLRRYSHIEL